MTIEKAIGKTIETMLVLKDESGILVTLTFTDNTEINVSTALSTVVCEFGTQGQLTKEVKVT